MASTAAASAPTRKPLPVKWSETENLKWKVKLPGPGSSSPIVVGQRVFVTCWTGYAVDGDDEGDEKDLRRHLICLDRETGKVLWDKQHRAGAARRPLQRHVHAARLRLAHAGVRRRADLRLLRQDRRAGLRSGRQASSGRRASAPAPAREGWGTASSPILYKDLVIVTASAESKSLVALDKETGKKVWRITMPASPAPGARPSWWIAGRPDRPGDRGALQDLGPQSGDGKTALALRRAEQRFDLHQRVRPRRRRLPA